MCDPCKPPSRWDRWLQRGLWLIVALWLACIVTMAWRVTAARAGEGPVDSLGCLARAAYYEARNQSPEAQREVVYTFLDRSQRWSISPCKAVATGSKAVQTHGTALPAEDKAWQIAQEAAILAWQAPKLDMLADKGGPMYFIDITVLKKPGFDTIYIGQFGDLIFFTEKPTAGAKP